MAWENRKNRSYFYRKMWVKGSKGRVVSEYHGTGEMGRIAQFTLGVRRHRRNMERAELYEMKEQDKVVDRAVNDFRRQVMQFVANTLQANGYHQHDRGHWRKRRDMSEPIEVKQPLASEEIGVFATVVEQQILEKSGLGREKSKSAIKRCLSEVAGIRHRLGWHEAPEHERLLITHIGLCWLRLNLCEFLLSNNSDETYKMLHVEHFERRVSVAHRRYLEALTVLARVRKLGINVQINVATNQQVVNNP